MDTFVLIDPMGKTSTLFPQMLFRNIAHGLPLTPSSQPPDCIPENFPTYLTNFHCLPKKSEAQKTFITVSSFIPLKVNFSFPRIWTILRLSKDFLIWLNCHEHDTFVLTILSFVEGPPQKGHMAGMCRWGIYISLVAESKIQVNILWQNGGHYMNRMSTGLWKCNLMSTYQVFATIVISDSTYHLPSYLSLRMSDCWPTHIISARLDGRKTHSKYTHSKISYKIAATAASQPDKRGVIETECETRKMCWEKK